MHYIREYFIKDPSICDKLFDITRELKKKDMEILAILHARWW